VWLSDCGDSTDSLGLESETLVESLSELGLAPGGTMAQQVFDDPYGLKDWEEKDGSRCFIHLTNSMAWRAVTGESPPTVPLTAADYTRHGMPWFDHYRDDLPAAAGTSKTRALKGVVELEKEKGVKVLPENESAHVKHVVKVGKAPGEVRDGSWK